jgi:hypothetical protein
MLRRIPPRTMRRFVVHQQKKRFVGIALLQELQTHFRNDGRGITFMGFPFSHIKHVRIVIISLAR